MISAGSHLPFPGILTHTIQNSAVLKCIFRKKKSYSPRFLLHRSGMVSLCSRSSSDNKRPLSDRRICLGTDTRLQSSRKPSCFAKFHLTKDQIFSVFLQQCQSPHNGSEIILQYPISLLFQKFTCYFFIFCTGPSPVFFILQSPLDLIFYLF